MKRSKFSQEQVVYATASRPWLGESGESEE
jgi:hypothetical protein